VASAGPYASLHLAPDRLPRQHPTTQETKYMTNKSSAKQGRDTVQYVMFSTLVFIVNIFHMQMVVMHADVAHQ